LDNGGFDVAIGNPPYVARTKIKDDWIKYLQPRYADIYANVFERTLSLVKPTGRLSLVVPLSSMFSEDFPALRKGIMSTAESWISSFDNIPDSLFTGVSQRCSVWICRKVPGAKSVRLRHTTALQRWKSEARPSLFQTQHYFTHPPYRPADPVTDIESQIPRFDTSNEVRLVQSVLAANYEFFRPRKNDPAELWFSTTARNYMSLSIQPPPVISLDCQVLNPSSKQVRMRFANEKDALAGIAALVSNISFAYWLVMGDGFDVTNGVAGRLACAVVERSKKVNLLSSLAALGSIATDARGSALQFKKNAGAYVGSYSYRRLTDITIRADLLVGASLNLSLSNVQGLQQRVERVRSINESAGEKGIPADVRSVAIKSQGLKSGIDPVRFAAIDEEIILHFGDAVRPSLQHTISGEDPVVMGE
jgi:hypothetical protein